MASALGEMIDMFNLKEPEIQAKIIKDFYSAFMTEKKLLLHDLLEQVDTRYLLNWRYLKKQTKDFEVNNGLEERALDSLFEKYNSNSDFDQILIKVIAINTLYSTRLHDYASGNTISIKEAANIIMKRAITSENSWDIVNEIGNKTNFELDRDVNNAFSFASKYMSFTYRKSLKIGDCIPIIDEYAKNVIRKIAFDEKYDFDSYSDYCRAMAVLKERYSKCDKSIGYKQIDSFLWIMGKAFR